MEGDNDTGIARHCLGAGEDSTDPIGSVLAGFRLDARGLLGRRLE